LSDLPTFSEPIGHWLLICKLRLGMRA